MTRQLSNRHVVDQLGDVDAKIAALTEVKKDLRSQIVAWGPGAYEGDQFRATVTASERGTLDMAAVRAKLSRQFIAANTNYTEVVTVRVVARNARELVS